MRSMMYYPSRHPESVGIGVEVIVHVKLRYFSATPDWNSLAISLQEIFEDIAPGVLVLNTMDHLEYTTRLGRKACIMSMLVTSFEEKLDVDLLRDYHNYLNETVYPISGALHVVWY